MTNNITITAGGNTTTIYDTKVEENVNKSMSVLALPTTFQEWSNGPQKPKIIDFLRVTRRFTVDGYIAASQVTQFRSIIETGGTFTFSYAGTNYTVNMEKYLIKETPEDAYGTSGPSGSKDPDHWNVTFTVVEGVNL